MMPDQGILGNLKQLTLSRTKNLHKKHTRACTQKQVKVIAGNQEFQWADGSGIEMHRFTLTAKKDRITFQEGKPAKSLAKEEKRHKTHKEDVFEMCRNSADNSRIEHTHTANTHKACINANKIPTHHQWSCWLWCRSTSKKCLKCFFILQSAACDMLYPMEQLYLHTEDSHMLTYNHWAMGCNFFLKSRLLIKLKTLLRNCWYQHWNLQSGLQSSNQQILQLKQPYVWMDRKRALRGSSHLMKQ